MLAVLGNVMAYPITRNAVFSGGGGTKLHNVSLFWSGKDGQYITSRVAPLCIMKSATFQGRSQAQFPSVIIGNFSWFSVPYMYVARVNCFKLLRHLVRVAFILDLLSTGRSIASKI